MKDTNDVIINDLLCFVANFSDRIPRDVLIRLVEAHFDSASIKAATELLMNGEQDAVRHSNGIGHLVEETVKAQKDGGQRFAATNLCSLPLQLSVEDLSPNLPKQMKGEEESMLVKILAEVQSLRRLVRELKGDGGSLSPHPSSTDGAEGESGGIMHCTDDRDSKCTNRSGSSPSIPNTETEATAYSSPESPPHGTGRRFKRKSTTESVSQAQGGAIENAVARIIQKRSKAQENVTATSVPGKVPDAMTLYGGGADLTSPMINNDESKSESSHNGAGLVAPSSRKHSQPEESRRKKDSRLETGPLQNSSDISNMTYSRSIPTMHLVHLQNLAAANGYANPLHQPLSLDVFGGPTFGNIPEISPGLSGVHPPPGFNNNFLRAWFALVQQAHSHNLSQGGSPRAPTPLFPSPPGSFPSNFGSQIVGGSTRRPQSPTVKREPLENPLLSPTIDAVKSPSLSTRINDTKLKEGDRNLSQLKLENSEVGSPPEDSENSFDGVNMEDSYYRDDESEGTMSPSGRNAGEWKGLLEDAIEKPYVCQHANCAKRFANKFLLKKHEFIHTGERPHQCQYCMKKFNRKDNLLRHKKTHLANAMCGVKRRHTLVFGVDDGVNSMVSPGLDMTKQFLNHQSLKEEESLDASSGRSLRGSSGSFLDTSGNKISSG